MIKTTLVHKILALAAAVPVIALSVMVAPQVRVAQAVEDGTTCSTMTLVSGTSTKTAGYTEVNPSSAPASLDAGLYSGGSLSAATATEGVIPPWIDPATNASFTGSGAVWVSTGASWPGGSGNTEGSSANDQWRLFQHDFSLPSNATVTSANLSFTADNAADVYLNGSGTVVATTNSGGVYGASPESGLPSNFGQVFTTPFSPVAGDNTLNFVVRNWSGDFDQNPTGLLYKATVDYCVPTTPSTVKVTILKYINGDMATAASASSTDFTMNAAWNAENIGSGSGQFTLGASGFGGDPTPYQAITADMSAGASYSVNEPTDGSLVGTSCSDGKPYALQGYTTGNTLAEAEAGTLTTAAPSLTDLTGNKTIIVWNRDCSVPYDVKVHVVKYLDGVMATAASSSNYQFPMTSTWRAENLNDNATTTGSYVLGNNHGGAADMYGADTVAMRSPAYYTTSEVTNGDSLVLPQDADCMPGKYRLQGYRVSPLSFEAAAAAPVQEDAPVFTNLERDQYVIVSNISCPGTSGSIGGDVVGGGLAVTGITPVDTTATADGTFENGWKYVFHITVPNDEPELAMKFSNWLLTSGSGTIPAANNMRISSAQANNSGATVMITAADTYSTPSLTINGDLNTSMAGKQVDVTVEVRIPSGTVNGSYTTNYGVRTLPSS